MKANLLLRSTGCKHRREIELTQEGLARHVGCTAITIRKIQAEHARTSVQIDERLVTALAMPMDDQAESA